MVDLQLWTLAQRKCTLQSRYPRGLLLSFTHTLQHDHGDLPNHVEQGPEHDYTVQGVACQTDVFLHTADIAIRNVALVKIFAEKLVASVV